MTRSSPRQPSATTASLHMLVSLARAVAQVRADPRAIAEAAVRALVQEFVDGSVINLAADLDVRVFAHRDFVAEEFLRDNFAHMPIELMPARSVLTTGKPIFHAQLPPELLAELQPEARAYVRRFSLHSVISVPIRAQQRVVGTLSIWRDRSEVPLGDDDLDIAHVCAEHVGLALEHAAVHAALRAREAGYRAFIATSTEGVWCYENSEPVSVSLPPEAQIEQWYERARLVECNDAVARMYGHERAEDLIGCSLDSLLPRADPRILEYMRAFIASGYKLVNLATVERDRHGVEHHFLNNLIGVVERGKLHRTWATQREVTELVRQREALTRYQLLSQHGRDIILFVRANTGEIVEANDAAVAAYGYTRDELRALTIEALRAEPRPQPSDTRTTDDGGVVFEISHRRKDGTTFPAEVSERGAEVHGERLLLNIIRDISLRRRVELELRESRNLFVRAFGKNPNPMTVNSLPAGEYVEVNEAAVLMGGFSREEMLGATPQALGIFADRDSRAAFERLLAEPAAARDLELRLRSKYGRIHIVLFSVEVIEYRDRACLLTVTHDITARKRVEWALLESEERLHQIASSIDEAFWLMEIQPRWGFVYVSPAWPRMWSRAPEELYADPDVWARPIHPDDRDLYSRAHGDLLAGRADSSDIEYRIVRPGGEVMWIRCRATLIRDVEGQPWRAAGIAEDITARKLDERERERLVSDLQVAIAVRDDFLSIASHELRTPLTALEFHLEHLVRLVDRGERDPHTLSRKVTSAVRQIDRVTALVDSLIHVSRMSLGRLTLELSRFDLVELVRDVIRRLAPDAQRARCDVRLDAPPRLPGAWDRKQLDQAIHNVLSNALKYGAGLPVDVRVRDGDGNVAIEVQDRGIGIADEDMPRIFDRFERAVSSSHYGGFGLGLYIARRIVEAHGGALDVASTPGHGSTFRALLPRVAAQP